MRALLLAGVGLALALVPLIARAADAPPTAANITQGVQGAQDVIRAQLSAIRARDADAAYAFMSHEYHEGHEDAKTFLSMMRFQHRAIYNHEDYTFLDKQGSGPVSIQKVRLTGRDGKPVTIIYRMEQQADGSWLIDSFTSLDEEAQPI